MEFYIYAVMTVLTRHYSFVICNNGYTIERYIHGWEDEYNDIQEWKFKDIPTAFGAKEYKGYQIKTREELTKLFADQNFASAPYLQVSDGYGLILLPVADFLLACGTVHAARRRSRSAQDDR